MGSSRATARQIGYFLGGYRFDANLAVDGEIFHGFRFGLGLNDRLDLGTEIVFASATDDADRHGFIRSLNLLLEANLGSGRVQPFADIGAGWFDFSQFDPAVDTSGIAPFAGLGLRFHVRPRLAGRLEGRYLNFAGLDVKQRRHGAILWGIDIAF